MAGFDRVMLPVPMVIDSVVAVVIVVVVGVVRATEVAKVVPLVTVAGADNKTVVELKLRMVVLAGMPVPVMDCPSIKPLVSDVVRTPLTSPEASVMVEEPLVVYPWNVNVLVALAAADIVTVLFALIVKMVAPVEKDPAVDVLNPGFNNEVYGEDKVTACPGVNPATDDSPVMIALPLLTTPVGATEVVTVAGDEIVMVLGVVAEVDEVTPVMYAFAGMLVPVPVTG